MRPDCDIAVVGGGLVGAASALALARSGFEVVLVEKAAPTSRPPTLGERGVDLRTVALSPGSVRLLERLGAWTPELREAACGYRAMEVWDADGTGRIRFEAEEVGIDHLGWIAENRAVLDALWNALGASEVRRVLGAGLAGATLEDESVRLALEDGRELRAHLVVGADGGGSRVRDLAGIPVDEEDTGQLAVVTLAELAESHQDTAWQAFLETGPVALLPLAGADRRWVSVVWSVDRVRAADLLELDDAGFAAALGRAIARTPAAVTAVDRRMSFPLVQRHARRYVAPGFVLVGDAAHVLHPLAGQGVNLGLKDVVALDDELRRLVHGAGRHLIGEVDLLGRYERRRRSETRMMLAAMAGLRRLFAEDALGVRWLRNAGLRWMGAAPPLKHRLMLQALGIEHAVTR